MDWRKCYHIGPEDVYGALHALDQACSEENIKASFTIVGGCAWMLLLDEAGIEFRATSDIDVVITGQPIEQAKRSRFHELLHDLSFEEPGGILFLPPPEDLTEPEKQRLIEGFRIIRPHLPTPELLACCKIFSDREKDLLDVTQSGLLSICDKGKLIELIEEYREYVLNPYNPNHHFSQVIRMLRNDELPWT